MLSYFESFVCLILVALCLHFTELSKEPTEATASRSFFYAGGHYENLTQSAFGTGQLLSGQIYVEKLVPRYSSQRYPLVFIAGAGQTSTNFLNTPDGREGWASFFLKRGYVLYLTDQPQRGRSPWIPGTGILGIPPVKYVQQYFTTVQNFRLWPQAVLHTQWPGSGLVGDPAFDGFFASQAQLQLNATISDMNNRAAYKSLLHQIGPAILITHSQSGPYGWTAGDECPNLVKGIVAIEPEGPPFVNAAGPTGPPRTYGITRLPLTYEPRVIDPAMDLTRMEFPPSMEGLTSCTRQAAPERRLKHLSRIPVMLVTGEASYHAPYDYCTVAYLQQAGVSVEWLELRKVGVHGNGHFLFMEKNNLEIARLVERWVERLTRT